MEDHQDTYELVAIVLNYHEVVIACTTAEGLRRATEEHFDVYLFDYNLPDGTGLDLCFTIRAFDEKTPILLCTASTAITEQDALIAGAQGFIEKGWGFVDSLESAVSKVLSTT